MGKEVRPEIEESGTRLATFERKGFARDNRPDVELRVVLDHYEGKPFVTIRQWEKSYGRFAPTKKGTSIRLSELPGLIEALQKALETPVEGPGRPPAVPREEPPRHRRTRESRRDQPPTRRPVSAASLPGVEAEPVDEFAEFRRHPRGSKARG